MINKEFFKHYKPQTVLATDYTVEDEYKRLLVQVDLQNDKVVYIIEHNGSETIYCGAKFDFVLDIFNNI